MGISKIRAVGEDCWRPKHEEYAELQILITVMPERYRDFTIRRIREQTGWEPNEAYFKEGPANRGQAPDTKRFLLHKYVYPRHGMDPERYFAIESNQFTRAMYAQEGIRAMPYIKIIGDGQ